MMLNKDITNKIEKLISHKGSDFSSSENYTRLENLYERYLRYSSQKQHLQKTLDDFNHLSRRPNFTEHSKDQEVVILKTNEELNNVLKELMVAEKDLLALLPNCEKRFNKYILFQNLRDLLAHSSVKLGQIEKQANCQPGYMSRLEKPENTSDPNIEFIVTAAEMLNVPVDLLLYKSELGINGTETYIINFLEKLCIDTWKDSLDWQKDSFERYKHGDFPNHAEQLHPLLSYDENLYYTYNSEFSYPIIYNSRFFPGDHFAIVDDCFHAALSDKNVTIYIMSCKKKNPTTMCVESLKEIYIYDTQLRMVCCSLTNNRALTDLIEKLYKSIQQYFGRVHIDDSVKSIIDCYMQK